MNLTTLAMPKFGYVDESTGITTDKNTVPIHPWYYGILPSNCGCDDNVKTCECTSIIGNPVRYLGPPIQNTNVAPTDPCSAHQAPSGYKYVQLTSGGACVLMRLSDGYIVQQNQVAATVTPVTTVVNTVTGAVGGITDQIKAIYASNPYLVYAAAGVGLYLLTKKI